MSTPIWYIFHGRFPSEKAASLWTRETARAMREAGASVTILAPRRLGVSAGPSHLLHTEVAYLKTLDFFGIPPLRSLAFWISSVTFGVTTLIYLLRHAQKTDAIFSNEPQAMSLVSLFFPHCFYELHVFPTRKTFLFRTLLRRMRGIVAITAWMANELTRTFAIAPRRIIHVPGGVDVTAFSIDMEKEEARKTLNLPLDAPIVLYTGHLYEWKGVETLAQAAVLLQGSALVVFVGGTLADVATFSRKYGSSPRIKIIGHQPHEKIPLWQRAADILVLPTSGKASIGRHYTSPMKLLEYMASGRPIVASDLPSTREVVSENTAMLAEADDPHSFARAIKALLADEAEGERLAREARKRVEQFTWAKRGETIVEFIRHAAPNT